MLPPLRLDVEYESFYHADLAWIGSTEFPPCFRSEKHSHDSWEFLYICKGHGHINAGYYDFDVQAKDMIVYPPHVEHSESASKNDPFSMKLFSVINTSDMDFLNFWPVRDKEFVKITGTWFNGTFERIIDAMLSELQSMDIAYSVRINALCFEFLSYLAMYAEKHGESRDASFPHSHVMRSKRYMEAHYTQNITLTDIAADSYVSTYYLSHVFKVYTGYSPIQYLISLRMNKAQDLLAHSEMSVTEISQEVGYEDLQHFSNAFKKYAGMSPRAYRNQAAGIHS